MAKPLTKTKTEEALAAQFKRDSGSLPGSPAIAAVRAEAMSTFEAMGLPSRRVEAYKYTDLRERYAQSLPLSENSQTKKAELRPRASEASAEWHSIEFLNGYFAGSIPPANASKHSPVHFDPLSKLLVTTTAGHWLSDHLAAATRQKANPIDALNRAFMTDGLALRIDNGADVPYPIALYFDTGGPMPGSTFTRNLVKVGDGARLTLVEFHDEASNSAHQANSVSEIVAEPGANFTHIKLVRGGAGCQHLSHWKVSVGANATYRAFTLTTDMGLARQDIDIVFAGEGAKIDVSGLMLGRGRSHIDTTMVIDHAVPGCESRELFKAVLDDNARAVFQGKVIVRPNAQKTDGKQMAKALMLSEACEFDSKPELEIYADDVICGHGATVAEISPELMFYLRSRGIPKDEARAMLIESFIGEALDKVEDETVREMLTSHARAWLAAKGDAA